MRRWLVLLLLPAAAVAFPGITGASTPAASAPVTVPATPGQTITRTWTGTIPTSATPGTSSCKGRADADHHDVPIVVPAGTYDKVDVAYKFTITWTQNPVSATSDEVLTVINKNIPAQGGGEEEGGQSNEVGSSDGSSNVETVTGVNLPSATYDAEACGYVNAAPKSYTAKVEIKTKAVEQPLASANPRGLGFSASVPADPQRDEGEPIIEIDPGGHSYTCGPTGFSNAAEYAQVSDDGGKQFHLLGEPPRGQLSEGGGGDCGIATSPDKNPQGAYNFAYSGLGPLTNFAVAASSDTGRTLDSRPLSGATIPGVDRQWHVFLDRDTVLLSYNQQQPRQVVVQRSTDGGRTYGVRVPATAEDPSFPGPMRALPAEFNPTGKANGRVPYFSWNDGPNINFAVSFDKGSTWKNCQVAVSSGDPTLFTTSDNDDDGNIYVAYGEDAKFHTYVSALHAADLQKCNEPVTKFPSANPGFSKPVQVDRDGVRSTVFPWLVAGGAPGRVAVAFYGSETDGDPNSGDFKGTWNVYVNQSLNALSSGATFSQVKSTTHPVHYDSICLLGLGCTVSGGDRSLADFFAIDYDRTRRQLQVVYDTTYKKPGDTEGSVATPTVFNQTAGPSQGGGSVESGEPAVVRTRSSDPSGDAIADYSTLAPSPRDSQEEPAADFGSVSLASGPNDGFAVTMKVGDLSDGALTKALEDAKAQRLLWVFRWFNGYQYAAAVARWTPTTGFTYGFNDFSAGSAQCGGTGAKCLQYPGDQPITGRDDRGAGTLTLEVPGSKLRALSGSQGPGQRPQEVLAKPGDRLYDGTAFSLADISAGGGQDQTFLYPLDNAPSMDFLVPNATGASGGTPPAGPTTSGGGGQAAARDALAACRSRLTFRSVSAVGRGRRAKLSFSRRGSADVQVDVFQSTVGRRVIGERLVARFKNRKRSFVWNGRANRAGRRVRDCYLFVRFKTGPGRGEARRIPLRRVGGRLSRRPGFQRRDTCDLLTSYKLERPAFGGRTGRPLGISFRLSRAGTARLRVTRGAHTVKTYALRVRMGARTKRLHLSARGLPRGDYRFRLVVRSRRAVTRSTLLARRL
jgi:hypothetical protein